MRRMSTLDGNRSMIDPYARAAVERSPDASSASPRATTASTSPGSASRHAQAMSSARFESFDSSAPPAPASRMRLAFQDQLRRRRPRRRRVRPEGCLIAGGKHDGVDHRYRAPFRLREGQVSHRVDHARDEGKIADVAACIDRIRHAAVTRNDETHRDAAQGAGFSRSAPRTAENAHSSAGRFDG